MLWIKALHIIFMVTWFAGLFYLPRLFVYHAKSDDEISNNRFKIMESRLYYGITTPGGLLTLISGLALIHFNPHYYLSAGWFHAKLSLVIVLIAFHFYCGHCLKQFKRDKNLHSDTFYRVLNEIPTIILVAVVILVVVKP